MAISIWILPVHKICFWVTEHLDHGQICAACFVSKWSLKAPMTKENYIRLYRVPHNMSLYGCKIWTKTLIYFCFPLKATKNVLKPLLVVSFSWHCSTFVRTIRHLSDFTTEYASEYCIMENMNVKLWKWPLFGYFWWWPRWQLDSLCTFSSPEFPNLRFTSWFPPPKIAKSCIPVIITILNFLPLFLKTPESWPSN